MSCLTFSCLVKMVMYSSTAIPLSIDHKPDRSDERQRIESAGGFIIWAGKVIFSVLVNMLGFLLLHFYEKWVLG